MSIKNFITVLLLLFSSCTVRQSLTIGFWNVENLFDLQDDPAKEDDEFTPRGDKQVTQEILNLKLNHLTEIIRVGDPTLCNLMAPFIDRPRYRQQEGPFKGYPFRFWAGDSLLGGYSDHLAVKVTLKKM